ncbi:MAG: metallophosphoesterase [Cyclobacteriaceae bacterium]
MKFNRKPMVNWYDPKQLAFTALKTVLSSVFGNFADRREMQAALEQEVKPMDYSHKQEMWIDYISDLGDGFNPTYAVASLLARENLTVDGNDLQRGEILVMGGDEIYPTPEMIEYDNRLRGPYNTAFPKDSSDGNRPHVYAIPGNHDWYDGLTNFLRLFTQKRSLGNWKTQQTRSYFALKLPQDYWLIAVDIQLNSDIDYPQICYFKEIAKKFFNEKSKVILCTSEPSWVYRSFDSQNTAHERFKFFINKVLFGRGEKEYEEKNKHIKISAILTGDLHHYARYEEVSKDGEICHLITAGGGGAFLHPTHTLNEDIESVDGYKGKLKKVFPSKSTSVKLSFLNLFFPFYSLTMLFFFGVFHLFSSWILQTKYFDGNTLMEIMAGIELFEGQVGVYINTVFLGLSHNPAALFLNILLFAGILVFTDTKSGKKKLNYIAGFVHGVLHLINFYFLFWLFSYTNLNHFEMSVNSIEQILLFTLEMVLAGGTISGILFGAYLTFSVIVLKNHITEAASSYRGEGFKNLLRIHINEENITIYPIGLKRVPKNWVNVGTEENPKFQGGPIKYEIIEEPIIIKHEKTI